MASIWFKIWGLWIRVWKLGIVGPKSSSDGGTQHYIEGIIRGIFI